MAAPKLAQFTLEEVSKHNSDGDLWVVIDNKVYDLSKFAKLHPGGRQVLLKHAGTDTSNDFKVFHHPSVLTKYGARLLIGEIASSSSNTEWQQPPGTFGDLIPYGDPIWYQRFNSPYYKDTHRVFRERVRRFVDTEIIPTLSQWCNDDRPPAALMEKIGREGLLAAMIGPPWPKDYLPDEVIMPQDFDYFHELIVFDEIARCGHSAAIGAITNGPAIALPVTMRFGSEELRRAVAPEVLLGRKFIALAISEPQAGSDVAGMQTVGIRDGDSYIINGNKKWITNGYYADYFVTAVATGGKGMLSFFVIDRDTPGFTVRKLDIFGSNVSGTAYLDFDECRVPISRLIGKEHYGFKLIMYNFNHERMYITVLVARLARTCLEESIKYALRRQAFGKRLADQQAIRMKIAAMARQVEQLQTWLEFVVYQMCTMSHQEANEKIGDVISLLKAQSSKVYEFCARETTMVFGGNSLYSGVGRKIEPAVCQVKGYQIPAGAEDVMDDFAARVAFKKAVKQARL